MKPRQFRLLSLIVLVVLAAVVFGLLSDELTRDITTGSLLLGGYLLVFLGALPRSSRAGMKAMREFVDSIRSIGEG